MVTVKELNELKKVKTLEELQILINTYEDDILVKESKKGVIRLDITNYKGDITKSVAVYPLVDKSFGYHKSPFDDSFSIIHIPSKLALMTGAKKVSCINALKEMNKTIDNTLREKVREIFNARTDLTQSERDYLANLIRQYQS